MIHAGGAAESDFTWCSIGKGLYYNQTVGSSPELRPFWPWLFNAEVDDVAFPSVSATLRTPSGQSRSLNQPESYPAGPFYFWDRKADKAGLDAAYPNGNYTGWRIMLIVGA